MKYRNWQPALAVAVAVAVAGGCQQSALPPAPVDSGETQSVTTSEPSTEAEKQPIEPLAPTTPHDDGTSGDAPLMQSTLPTDGFGQSVLGTSSTDQWAKPTTDLLSESDGDAAPAEEPFDVDIDSEFSLSDDDEQDEINIFDTDEP